ncbi:MAG: 50S ribosomal protein L4 [Thermotogae bacterium]|nr:50S ribosomal protein L4 [Thermotogota bacterium]
MRAPVFNLTGEKTGERDLPEDFLGIKPNGHLLWEAVRSYLYNQRQGTHHAKSRGEVIGSRRKIWPQKHMGRARHGDRYAPIFVGGGKAHGPKPKEYNIRMPKKARRLALRMALADRAQNRRIYILENTEMETPKTSKIFNFLKATDLVGKNVLFVPKGYNRNFYLSARNIPDVEVLHADQLNTYHVLWADYVVVEDGVIEKLRGRLL